MVPGQTYAQGSSPVVITAWGMHYGGQIVYRYQVQNFGSVPISKFIIGLYQPVTEDGFAELSVLPKSNDSSFWLPQHVARRPDGWGALLVFPEESETFAIEWVEAAYHRKIWPQGGKGDSAPVARVPPIFVPPQGALDTFSVTLPEADFNYVTGHASVDYGDQTLTIPIQKGDSTPPTISVNVKRVNQNDGNGNWAILEIEASSKDNYDPNPTLVFEPVLANQPLQNGDVIVDAKRGGWKVKLKNMAGRTYQLKLSSQDASGNKSTRSFDHPAGR
jgi:hypothetical protein